MHIKHTVLNVNYISVKQKKSTGGSGVELCPNLATHRAASWLMQECSWEGRLSGEGWWLLSRPQNGLTEEGKDTGVRFLWWLGGEGVGFPVPTRACVVKHPACAKERNT